MPATKQTIDFTNVKDGGNFNKKHYPDGDYPGKILDVKDTVKKDDKSKKMWLFSIRVGAGTYPYYCQLGDEKLFWKIRNLFEAAGFTVPKKRMGIDPNKLIGKPIGVTLQETEYDDKLQSEVAGVLTISEVEGGEVVPSEGDEEDEDDEAAPAEAEEEDEDTDEEEATPPPKKKKKKKKTQVTDDEMEELDIEDV